MSFEQTLIESFAKHSSHCQISTSVLRWHRSGWDGIAEPQLLKQLMKRVLVCEGLVGWLVPQ